MKFFDTVHPEESFFFRLIIHKCYYLMFGVFLNLVVLHFVYVIYSLKCVFVFIILVNPGVFLKQILPTSLLF